MLGGGGRHASSTAPVAAPPREPQQHQLTAEPVADRVRHQGAAVHRGAFACVERGPIELVVHNCGAEGGGECWWWCEPGPSAGLSGG